MKQTAKIAILDNSIKPEMYRPVDHWTSFFDADFESFRAPEHQFPDLDQGFTHMIVTGSEASIIHRDDWVPEEMKIVKDAMDRDIPILGSCWGHQLLALIIRGPEAVRRAPVPELGWLTIRINEGQEFFGDTGSFQAFSLHFDEVVDPGPDFRILASTEDCSIHAFQYRDRPIWGIQSHPEINIENGKSLLEDFGLVKPEIEPLIRKALDGEKRDSCSVVAILERFLSRG